MQRNSGFPYSDINAIIGKDQSSVGGGKLVVGHLDGRLESETTDLGEGNKMVVVERKNGKQAQLAEVRFPKLNLVVGVGVPAKFSKSRACVGFLAKVCQIQPCHVVCKAEIFHHSSL